MREPAVFISAKSEDYACARAVFEFLSEQGFRCFFSDETLAQMGEADYKDAIDSAIDVAPHLVVVTSSRANAETKWVKYEWNTFANELLSGRKDGNLLTIACGDLQPGDLPLALRQKQVLRFPAELAKLPRFLPGARVTTTGAAPASAAGGEKPSALEQLVARWLRPSWIGTLKYSRWHWIVGYVTLAVVCTAVIAVGGCLFDALAQQGVPVFLAGLAGLVLAAPGVVLFYGGAQWFAQLRLPASRYWWLVLLLGSSLVAESCRNATFQTVQWLLAHQGGLAGYWWDRLAAVVGLAVFGVVAGMISAHYLGRHVQRPWIWVGYYVVAALPLNLFLFSGQETLKSLGVSAAWVPMASILPSLWLQPILAFGFWNVTRAPKASPAEPGLARAPEAGTATAAN